VAKKKDKNTDKIFLHHSSSTFCEFISSLLLENGCQTSGLSFVRLI